MKRIKLLHGFNLLYTIKQQNFGKFYASQETEQTNIELSKMS